MCGSHGTVYCCFSISVRPFSWLRSLLENLLGLGTTPQAMNSTPRGLIRYVGTRLWTGKGEGMARTDLKTSWKSKNLDE